MQLIDDYGSLFLTDTPLIDLRAPVEFAEGAFPTAHSLPLMSDAERAAVGTCYKQQGQAAAIALGHRLVSGEVRQAREQAWLDFLSRHPTAVLYCFRGGLRSETVQQWLAARGQPIPRVAGGYKALRQFLIRTLEDVVASWPIWLLSGMTGSGKTDLLVDVPQAVDLEGHARHRGSSFGALPEPQPGNIDFENGLAIELLKRQARGQWGMLLEDESRMIGRCTLPLPLFQAMEQAPLVVLEATLEERVARIERDYVVAMAAHFGQQLGEEDGLKALHNFLSDGLARLTRRLGDLNYRRLAALLQQALDHQAATGETRLHHAWIGPLLTDYYDPIYQRSLDKRGDRVLFRGPAEACRHYLQDLMASAEAGRP